MEGLLILSRRIDALNTKIGQYVSYAILAAVLVSAINAVIRKVFNYSSNAWLEAQWYLFSAVFLLCAAYTLLRDEHVRIDLIFGRLARRTQIWIELLGTLFFLMPACFLIMWLSWPVFMDAFRTGEISGNAGGLPLWPARILVPLGFFLLLLQGVSEAVKRVAVLFFDADESLIIVEKEPEIDTSIIQVKE